MQYRFRLIETNQSYSEPQAEQAKYQVIDSIPPELKDNLISFFKSNGISPNHYYPEDASDDQAIKRYLGKDEKNWSIRIAATTNDGEIISLLDTIPLEINDGELLAYASYAYGEPTDDHETNQLMIEMLVKTAMLNPDKKIQWMVFNDLSKHDDARWINELEKFGFIQPYRFENPTFKDTVILVHVLRNSARGGYPITAETDVRNAQENLPENAAAE